MKANIQAVSLKIQTLRSQNTMAQAMKGVTKAMQSMNKYVILRLFIVLELQLFYYFLINTFCSFHKLFSIIHLFIFLRCWQWNVQIYADNQKKGKKVIELLLHF